MDIKTKYNLGQKTVHGLEVKGIMINIRNKEIATEAFDGQEIEILYNLYKGNVWAMTADETYMVKHCI